MRVLPRWLAVPRQSRPLVLSSLVDSTGSGLYLSGAVVFFTRSAGLSAAQVGLGLTVGGICGVVALVPLGMLTDRIGPRRTAALLHFWQAIGFVAYAFVHNFATFLAAACFLGIPAQAVLPVAQVFVEHHAGPELRVRLMAVFRSIYNVGFTLGALLTTAVLAIDNRAAYLSIVLGDGASFLLAGFLLLRVPLLAKPPATAVRVPRLPRSLRQRWFLVVTLLNAVISLHITLLVIGVPAWATLHTSAPREIIGVLFVLNTMMIVTFQVRVSRGTDSVAGGVRALRLAAVFLAAASVTLTLAAGEGPVVACVVLVAGTALLTFGELFQSSGGVGLSYRLAPPDQQGEYLAVFGLGKGVQYMAGPALVTIAVIGHGTLGWVVLALGFLAAGWAVGPAANAASKEMVGRPAGGRHHARTADRFGRRRRQPGRHRATRTRHGIV